MIQVFYHYQEWEDYQAGMYSHDNKDYSEELIERAKDLLSDLIEFEKSAREMIFNWHKSASHNLTNKKINRRSWIGQATCCYELGIPEILTRESWSRMTPLARLLANRVATKLIKEYEIKNRELHKNMGETGLF
jgi:hypothetical protein